MYEIEVEEELDGGAPPEARNHQEFMAQVLNLISQSGEINLYLSALRNDWPLLGGQPYLQSGVKTMPKEFLRYSIWVDQYF